jgi:(p)ppGpp synthase/HD superfamily hydrolase
MSTTTDKRDNVAHMLIKITITGLPQLSQVLSRIARLPNVVGVRRKK